MDRTGAWNRRGETLQRNDLRPAPALTSDFSDKPLEF